MTQSPRFFPTLCLAAALGGWAVSAAAADEPAPADQCGGAPGWHHGHDGGPGDMGRVLHQLNLSADQKAQIKAIMAGEKSRFDALHESVKANWQALAATPPTDPGYAALVETEQRNAATRITLEHEIWRQIYESVLTKAQQQQVPGLAAAAQAAHESRMGAWKSQHPPPPAD